MSSSCVSTSTLQKLIANRHARACSSTLNSQNQSTSSTLPSSPASVVAVPSMSLQVSTNDDSDCEASMHSTCESPGKNVEMPQAPSHSFDVGNYTVLSALQQGCWGEVRVGVHKTTGRKVCLKFIASSFQSTCAKINLSNEVSNLARCEHPGTSHVDEVLEIRTPSFTGTVLVMPMYDHGDLLEYIQHGQTLDEKLARFVFRQLVDIVSFCHDHKVAHLDIKPEHLLFDNNYSIKLVDFGHSCCFKTDTFRAFSNRGTVPFMAPEVISCETTMADISTDNGFEVLPHCTLTRPRRHHSQMPDSKGPIMPDAPRVHRLSSSTSSPELVSPAPMSCTVSSVACCPPPGTIAAVNSRSSVDTRSDVPCGDTTMTSPPPPAPAAVPTPSATLPPSTSCSSTTSSSSSATGDAASSSSRPRSCRKSWKLELPPSPRRKKLEHLFEESYDARAADVWSCGILLATILFGAHPFDHAHHSDLRYAIFARNPKCFWKQFGLEHKVTISKDCEALLNGMLDPNPRTRSTLKQVSRSAWFMASCIKPEQFKCAMDKRFQSQHRSPCVTAS